jgi:hypothetical protein
MASEGEGRARTRRPLSDHEIVVEFQRRRQRVWRSVGILMSGVPLVAIGVVTDLPVLAGLGALLFIGGILLVNRSSLVDLRCPACNRVLWRGGDAALPVHQGTCPFCHARLRSPDQKARQSPLGDGTAR